MASPQRVPPHNSSPEMYCYWRILDSTRARDQKRPDSLGLAGLGKLEDYFVMDAFGILNGGGGQARAQLSAAGFLLDKELKYLKGAVNEREKPLCAIIRGANASKWQGDANVTC